MIKKYLNNKISQGVSSVLLANIINKVVSFICNVLVVRLLTQDEYGTFISANNIVATAMLITGLGTTSGSLQYGAEQRSEDEKNSYFRECLETGVIFDVFLVIATILYAFMGMSPVQSANVYIGMLAPTIILHYIFEYIGSVLRSQRNVEAYARLLNVNSVLYSMLSCIGAECWNIEGLIIGRYIAYIISICIGIFYLSDRISSVIRAKRLEKKQYQELMEYSVSCCLIAALNRLLYYLDIAVITYIVMDSAQIAVYKVGIQIPEALDFIPSSVLVTVIPYFTLHNKDVEWLKRWTRRLYAYSILANFVIMIFLLVFAEPIVTAFWGTEYIQSVAIFRILSLSYFVGASFRQIGTSILSILRYTRYNLFISVITGVCNLILDIVLVKRFGIIGAAWATVLVVLLASCLSFPYVYWVIYKVYDT